MKATEYLRGSRSAACLALAALTWFALRAGAAPPAGIERTTLLKEDSSIAGRDGIVISVVLATGAAEGRHTHDADVYGYVIEGSATLEMAGNPTRIFRRGEAFHIPAGVVHQGINNGAVATRIVAVLIAEKGKPVTTPVK
jgi:quercetin dioxygenase-like cupin family protein